MRCGHTSVSVELKSVTTGGLDSEGWHATALAVDIEQYADRFELVGEGAIPFTTSLGIATLTYEARHCAPPAYRVGKYVFLTVVGGSERCSAEGTVCPGTRSHCPYLCSHLVLPCSILMIVVEPPGTLTARTWGSRISSADAGRAGLETGGPWRSVPPGPYGDFTTRPSPGALLHQIARLLDALPRETDRLSLLPSPGCAGSDLFMDYI